MISARGGNDTVVGQGGNDEIYGQPAGDSLSGGNGVGGIASPAGSAAKIRLSPTKISTA